MAATRPPATACAVAIASSVAWATMLSFAAPVFSASPTEPFRKASEVVETSDPASAAPTPTRPPAVPRASDVPLFDDAVSILTSPVAFTLVPVPIPARTVGVDFAVASPPATPASSPPAPISTVAMVLKLPVAMRLMESPVNAPPPTVNASTVVVTSAVDLAPA